MLSVSYTASERLDHMLADAMLADAEVPEDAVIRLVLDGDGFNLGIDKVRSGDTTFDHLEKVVFAIDVQVSKLLADKKLDVKVRGEKPELILIERLEE